MAGIDLTHWHTQREFAIAQAACLIAGHDPHSRKSMHDDERVWSQYNLAMQQLKEDYGNEVAHLRTAFEIFSPFPEKNRLRVNKFLQERVGIRSIGVESVIREIQDDAPFLVSINAGEFDENLPPIEADRFSRKELIAWCESRGWASAYDFSGWKSTDEGTGIKRQEGENCPATGNGVSPESADVATSAMLARDISQRLQNNLEALIAAMAMKHYQYDASDAKSAVPAKLVALLEIDGVTLSPQTIRGYLSRGAARLGKKK